MPGDPVGVGGIEVWPPAVSGQRWWFDVDLAGLVGEHLQSDALEQMRPDLAGLDVTVDAEADVVSFSAADPESIGRAAIAILTRAGRTAPALPEVLGDLANVRIGQRQTWRVGDLFTVPLRDGRGGAEPDTGERFTLGQIVGIDAGGGPTIAWFGAFATRFDDAADAALDAPVLSVLHTVGENLDDGTFRVIGHTETLADPSLAKRGSSTGDGSLIGLARAYLGLDPWNVLADRRHFEFMLLPEHRGTLPRAVVLDEHARRAYREREFGILG